MGAIPGNTFVANNGTVVIFNTIPCGDSYLEVGPRQYCTPGWRDHFSSKITCSFARKMTLFFCFQSMFEDARCIICSIYAFYVFQYSSMYRLWILKYFCVPFFLQIKEESWKLAGLLVEDLGKCSNATM